MHQDHQQQKVSNSIQQQRLRPNAPTEHHSAGRTRSTQSPDSGNVSPRGAPLQRPLSARPPSNRPPIPSRGATSSPLASHTAAVAAAPNASTTSLSSQQLQSSSGTSMLADMIESFRHLQRTEKVVRLEIERRSIRESIRVHDDMMHFVNEQLQYVADFKREWLAHMRGLELERQEEVAREAQSRQVLEDACAAELSKRIIELQSTRAGHPPPQWRFSSNSGVGSSDTTGHVAAGTGMSAASAIHHASHRR